MPRKLPTCVGEPNHGAEVQIKHTVGRGGYSLTCLLRKLIIPACRESSRLASESRTTALKRCGCAIHPLHSKKTDGSIESSVFWWAEVDSNHRRQSRQIYSLLPLAARESARILYSLIGGAGDRNRTNNLLITNQLLCQLSYTSKLPFRVVPRGGIEPPTRGFSVPCSTD